MLCSEHGISYLPLDMDGTFPKVVKDVSRCQARCAETRGCAHYSYWTPARHCHIQAAGAARLKGQLLFVAGPPRCPGQPPAAGAQELVEVPFGAADVDRQWPLRQRTAGLVAAHAVPFGLLLGTAGIAWRQWRRAALLRTPHMAGVNSYILIRPLRSS